MERAQQPNKAVVEAVVSAEGVEPTALEPLRGVIDLDALDLLFEHRTGDCSSAGCHLPSTYPGCKVIQRGNENTVLTGDYSDTSVR